MQKLFKAVVILGLTATIAACGGRRADTGEDVIFVPNPVTPDPVSTKF